MGKKRTISEHAKALEKLKAMSDALTLLDRVSAAEADGIDTEVWQLGIKLERVLAEMAQHAQWIRLKGLAAENRAALAAQREGERRAAKLH